MNHRPATLATVAALALITPAIGVGQTPTAAPAPAAAAASAPGAAADQALEVSVTYSGKGQVSKAHEISIFLFTEPNITEGSVPVAVGTVEQNGAAHRFTGLPPVVYIAVVYDDTGTYEREGPPPSGTPIFIHGMASGGAGEAVKTGKDVKVTLTFDDSNRM